MNIFIIGKIGSGKTTVAEMFSQHENTNLIDADMVGREVLRLPHIQKRLLERFGELLLVGKDKEIDPASLAERAFKDKESVEKLNAIMHPEIFNRIKAMLKEQEINLIDLPLPDATTQIKPDHTILVECPDDLIRERCDFPEKLGRQQYITIPDKPDFTIDNSGSMESTQTQVDRIWQQMTG